MPFLARCTYCGRKTQAPDHMLGASGRCRKCNSFFTLVPLEETSAPVAVPAPVSPPTPTAAAGLPKAFPPAPAAPGKPVPEGVQPAPAQPGSWPPPPSPVAAKPASRAVSADEYEPPKLLWIEPVGACALFLGGLALLCALGYSSSFLVIPMGLGALLLGLVSVWRAQIVGKFRLLIPAAAPVVGGVASLLALLWPQLLGPTYVAARAKGHVDPTVIRAVPLNAKPGSAVLDPEWVDASVAALQQGQVRVQVVGVSIGPLDAPSAEPPAKGKKPPEKFIFLRLLTRRLVDDGRVAAGPQIPRNENARPKLTDNTGKVYRQQDVEIVTIEEKDRPAVPPRGLIDELFVYEAPAEGVQYLRWEVPAGDGAGGKTFRFTIPRSMFRRH